MENNKARNSFILLKKDKQEPHLWNASPVLSKSQLSQVKFENEDFLVYSEEKKVDFTIKYLCTNINLPYINRKALINHCNRNSLYEVANELFDVYVSTADMINSVLLRKFEGVYIFCNIYNYDFCLVSTLDWDIEILKTEVIQFIDRMLIKSVYSEELFEKNLIIQKSKRMDCIKSGRQFVKYNPNFKEYIDIMNLVTEIECDSIDRQMELSLFSNLILKDLVENTHLYWLYESGEIRQMLSDENQILSERDDRYFRYFNLFCKQANDRFIYHDWIWCLVFLTSTLLSTLKFRSIELCESEKDEYEHKNFFGFVPVIEDAEKNNSEVMSLFTRHISRNFCHGFLVIPSDAIYDLPRHIPAYIHEFFHYIPPKNRPERNMAIFELTLHSLLFDLRNKLSKNLYKEAYDMFSKELLKTTEDFGFNKDSLFDCDSMEFLDRIKNVFLEANFNMIYDFVFFHLFTFQKNIDLFDIFRISKKNCINRFEDSSINGITAFTSFFREIRSDIAMCLFLGIGTKEYIRILANEPLFAALPSRKCADSTIMRFGFMCRYLGKDIGKNDPNWTEKYFDLIDTLISETENISELNKMKYLNLKGYLIEYDELAIESINDAYVEKGTCFLENFIVSKGILSVWEQSIQEYLKHDFSNEVRHIYRQYMDCEKNLEANLKSICGIRLLFRDLPSYDGNIDIAT